jgi:molybdopterin/thiamine biosynthesis adenylyltransferase
VLDFGAMSASRIGDLLASKSVLLVGVGGLGSPVAIALARAKVGTIGLADDDEVELGNLHRQILFAHTDIGSKKTAAAAYAVRAWAAPSNVRVNVHDTRLLPENALDMLDGYDLVVEGSDNFATKFLAADACALAKRPIVHAAAVRWHGTALAVGPRGAPCYRCLFEDLPREAGLGCSEAGVVGPVVGVVGALQADLALSVLAGRDVFGTLVTFDGKTDRLRRRIVVARPDCPLCGSRPTLRSLDSQRYAVDET